MSKQYLVTRSFYEGNGLHEEGQTFEHSDQDYIEKCLADGNIAEVSEGGSESTTPLPEGATVSDSPDTPQAVTPAAPVPQEPQTPVETAPQNPPQPSPEEIAATLAASESDSAPSGGVEIS